MSSDSGRRAGRTGSAPAAGVQSQLLGFEARAEVAMVRDRDHRPWVRRERRLKVLDRVECDVVGRLVEDGAWGRRGRRG